MKNNLGKLLLFVLITVLLNACTKDDDGKTSGMYSKGVFITNEGPFQSGTGTITFFNPDSSRVYQNIFETANSRPLGNVVQSMTIYNGFGYIVVNNAAKVEIVNVSDFKSTGTILNFTSPRYFLGLSNNKAYVTDWDGSVKVVDIAKKEIISEIACGSGPEQMLWSGKYVFVLNSGGFVTDSTVTVIDPVDDKVIRTIHLHHRPTGIVPDEQGKIWVMCSGKGFNGWPVPGDTPGKLIRINPNTLSVDFTYDFPGTDNHPEKLVVNNQGSELYFLYKNCVYSYNIMLSGSQPVKRTREGNYYTLGYDRVRNTLYVSDPVDYTSNGWVYRFAASDGALIDSIRAGVIPGGFAFN